ncbi:hypothetical protein [Pseudomonas sp. RT6P73]
MNTQARIAIIDILQTIDTLNNLGKQVKIHILDGPEELGLEEDEILLLKGTFTLMRRTLDALTPLLWNAGPTTPKEPKKPTLYLV